MKCLKPIEEGIHYCFDIDLKHSYKVVCGEKTIGYINYTVNEEKGAWIHFILAIERGSGYGDEIIDCLFSTRDIEYIEGTSIYEPSQFWKKIGAVFEEDVDEDDCDGVYFKLSKSSFYKYIGI